MKNITLSLSIALALPALAPAGMAEHVSRQKIDGIDVIAYPTAIHDVVTIAGALPAGTALALAEGGNPTVASLTATLLDRGTTREDKFAIARKLDSVGATIQFGVRDQALHVQAKCLRKDLPLVLSLIAEQLRSPAFSQEELDLARKQYIGQIENQSHDVQARATEAFKRTVFPPGHPNYQPSLDELKAAAATLTIDQVKAFHDKHYGPAHMTLVLVGDVTIGRAKSALSAAFSGWKGGADYLKDAKPAGPQAAPAPIAVEIPGKTSAILMVGEATGLRDRDPDSLPLEVATAVLGSGFTGRLMHAVRDQEGLTYGINARLSNNTFSDGAWIVTGTFAPQLLSKGTASTQREVQHWWKDGVTGQELSARKTNIVGSYQVGLATTTGMAETLLDNVLAGRSVSWIDEYPRAVQALTASQVNGAIQKYLDPAKMVVIKSGSLPKAD